MQAISSENRSELQRAVSRVRACGRVGFIVTAMTVLPLECGAAPGGAQPALSTFDEVCVIMDREASAGIATILLGAPANADARLDEALVRLRRARTYCDRVWVDPARVEFNALRKAFPLTDRQVLLLFETGRAVAALGTPQREPR